MATLAPSAPETAPEADAPAVRLSGIRRVYGDVVAVAGVDLDIAAGEFFTLLGPSGSGKTTTLRVIAGFERPDAGRVELQGVDVTRVAPAQRAVNTVFQDYALFPHMTVAENVEYGLRVKGMSRRDRRARAQDVLERVRLPGLGDRKPVQLSGGQRQRVALARAIVNGPPVLLLDEPLGALDLKLRQEMQIFLKALQRDLGITFVYVTHDQEEALTMSDRLAVFNEGRIEQLGSPAEVYERPQTEFVAGFVGVSNILERDGRRFTVRPEKILMSDESGQRRAGDDRRGRLRRHGHALRRRPRRGRPARRRQAEPGDVLAGGALGEGEERPPLVAAGAHVRDGSRRREHVRRIRKRSHVSVVLVVAVTAALAFVASGCGGGGRRQQHQWQHPGRRRRSARARARST